MHPAARDPAAVSIEALANQVLDALSVYAGQPDALVSSTVKTVQTLVEMYPVRDIIFKGILVMTTLVPAANPAPDQFLRVQKAATELIALLWRKVGSAMANQATSALVGHIRQLLMISITSSFPCTAVLCLDQQTQHLTFSTEAALTGTRLYLLQVVSSMIDAGEAIWADHLASALLVQMMTKHDPAVLCATVECLTLLVVNNTLPFHILQAVATQCVALSRHTVLAGSARASTDSALQVGDTACRLDCLLSALLQAVTSSGHLASLPRDVLQDLAAPSQHHSISRCALEILQLTLKTCPLYAQSSQPALSSLAALLDSYLLKPVAPERQFDLLLQLSLVTCTVLQQFTKVGHSQTTSSSLHPMPDGMASVLAVLQTAAHNSVSSLSSTNPRVQASLAVMLSVLPFPTLFSSAPLVQQMLQNMQTYLFSLHNLCDAIVTLSHVLNCSAANLCSIPSAASSDGMLADLTLLLASCLKRVLSDPDFDLHHLPNLCEAMVACFAVPICMQDSLKATISSIMVQCIGSNSAELRKIALRASTVHMFIGLDTSLRGIYFESWRQLAQDSTASVALLLLQIASNVLQVMSHHPAWSPLQDAFPACPDCLDRFSDFPSNMANFLCYQSLYRSTADAGEPSSEKCRGFEFWAWIRSMFEQNKSVGVRAAAVDVLGQLVCIADPLTIDFEWVHITLLDLLCIPCPVLHAAVIKTFATCVSVDNRASSAAYCDNATNLCPLSDVFRTSPGHGASHLLLHLSAGCFCVEQRVHNGLLVKRQKKDIPIPEATCVIVLCQKMVMLDPNGVNAGPALAKMLSYLSPDQPDVHGVALACCMELFQCLRMSCLEVLSLHPEVLACVCEWIICDRRLVSEIACQLADQTLEQFVQDAFPKALPALIFNCARTAMSAGMELLGKADADSRKACILDQCPSIVFYLLMHSVDLDLVSGSASQCTDDISVAAMPKYSESQGQKATSFLVDELLENTLSMSSLIKNFMNDLMTKLMTFLADHTAGCRATVQVQKVNTVKHVLKAVATHQGVDPKDWFDTRLLPLFHQVHDQIVNTIRCGQTVQELFSSMGTLVHLIHISQFFDLTDKYATHVLAILSCLWSVTTLRKSARNITMQLLQNMTDAGLKLELNYIICWLFHKWREDPTLIGICYTYIFFDRELMDSTSTWQARIVELIPELQPLADSFIQGKQTLEERILDLLAASCEQESTDARQIALQALTDLVKNNGPELWALVQQRNPVVSCLSSTLLDCCKDGSSRIRFDAAECLGVLGAVDPAAMNTAPKAVQPVTDDITLCTTLISKYLVPLIHFSSPSATPSQIKQLNDKVCHGIQELLRYCVQKSRGNAKPHSTVQLAELQRYDWWTNMSCQVRQKCEPYLNSRFKIYSDQNQSHPPDLFTGQFEIFSPGQNIRSWVYLFCRKMVEQLTDSHYRTIFQTVRPALRSDLSLGLFCLPHIAIKLIVTDNKVVRSAVACECKKVLQNAKNAPQHVQVVCDLVDTVHSNKWQLQKEKLTGNHNAGKLSHLTSFLQAVPSLDLADACLKTQAFARALQHLEDHLQNVCDPKVTSGTLSEEHFRMFQECYRALHDTESLAGLFSLRRANSLQDWTVELEAKGDWNSALAATELMLESNTTASGHISLLLSLQNLGHFQQMLSHVHGLLLSHSDSVSDRFGAEDIQAIMGQGVQAAWCLGRWKDVEVILDKSRCTTSSSALPAREGVDPAWSVPDVNKHQFELGLARALLALKNGDLKCVRQTVQDTRMILCTPLLAAAMESYSQAYAYVVQLHMLADVEIYVDWLQAGNIADADAQCRLTKSLSMRANFLESTASWQEPVFALHRCLYTFAGMYEQYSTSWLHWAKNLRKFGFYQIASSAVLHALSSPQPPAKVFLEQAKLVHDMGDTGAAIAIAGSGMVPVTDGCSKARRIKAKMSVLHIQWGQELNCSTKDEVESGYKQVMREDPKWEGGYFHFACFLDSYVTKYRESCKLPGLPECRKVFQDYQKVIGPLPAVLEHYGKAVCFGKKHSYHAMSRMTTLWFNYSAEMHCVHSECQAILASRSSSRSASPVAVNRDQVSELQQRIEATCTMVQQIISDFASRISSDNWMVVWSTLVSRINHQHVETQHTLCKLIIQLVMHHPQQTLWLLLSQANSSNQSRRQLVRDKVVQELTSQLSKSVRSDDKKILTLITEAQCFCEAVIRFCDQKIEKKNAPCDISKLPAFRTVFSHFPLPLIIPLMRQLMPNHHAQKAYPSVLIAGMEHKAQIMPSMMLPRKVTIKGSDGKQYPFLCKPKDDMRKDARMMELCSVVNRMLHQTYQTHARGLQLRTFAAVPLSDNCGMVEWVQHTQTLRSICDEQARMNGISVPFHEIDKALKDKSALYNTYQNHLFPRVPKWYVSRWMRQKHSLPSSWIRARANWAKSCASWSAVGFVWGLGDRHCENILVDSHTGEAVHIDFSLLFERGKTLDVPEIVPFRMTRNMVDAMGVTGVEGCFKQSMCATLTMMHEQKELLMGLLELFVHDPLVEWTRASRADPHTKDQPAMVASQTMKQVSHKLCGYIGEDFAHPLSAQGQVQQLVSQATSLSLLCKMYIGWMAWL